MNVAPTVLSLCSGYGGLELAVHSVYRHSRVVGYVEWEAYSAALLLARMEEATLEPAPIWCGDLAELPAAPFLGVDLITAGFSCQPWSSAGKGLGTEDERWIWPDIARLADRVGCGALFLENVPPLITRRGLDLVLGDLAARGFDAEWTLLPASSIGATHERERLFILAYARGARRPEISGSSPRDEGEHAWWTTVEGDLADGAVEDVADRDHDGRPQLWRQSEHDWIARNDLDGRSGAVLVDADSARRQRSGRAESDGRGELARTGFPPGPDDLDEWAELLAIAPGLEPSLRREADGSSDWLGTAYASVDDQLRTLGNGVVWQCAAAALRLLTERMKENAA